jgi:RimJ/RimL family protein N-acetyltransferase/N-acetylglutamate synthase-like GNAT family acetyltransferase
MKTIHIRPAEPERDFGQIAELISSQEDERTSEAEITKDLAKHQENVIRLAAADNEDGELMGFSWAYRNNAEPERVTFYLVVKPEMRRQSAGGRLYEDLLQACWAAQAKKLRVSILDGCPECREFAERRGFVEKRHHFAMALDLERFDFQPYGRIIDRLKGEGFQFTSMEALGNTEEAQLRLYALNDSVAATTPGTEGEHPWASFEDFQESVCRSDWYKPGGQVVIIDAATGKWAAMSAITRLDKNEHAYNLFTGVDPDYRGRKLGQAVKVTALRYARESLKVKAVRTHHNTRNDPMIAIDRKLGYTFLPGTYLMEKVLE